MIGKTTYFNKLKGFGFIRGEDGMDYFVHITSLPKNTYLEKDNEVEFELIKTERGLQARNVKILS